MRSSGVVTRPVEDSGVHAVRGDQRDHSRPVDPRDASGLPAHADRGKKSPAIARRGRARRRASSRRAPPAGLRQIRVLAEGIAMPAARSRLRTTRPSPTAPSQRGSAMSTQAARPSRHASPGCRARRSWKCSCVHRRASCAPGAQPASAPAHRVHHALPTTTPSRVARRGGRSARRADAEPHRDGSGVRRARV